jgi:hypothetical protein
MVGLGGTRPAKDPALEGDRRDAARSETALPEICGNQRALADGSVPTNGWVISRSNIRRLSVPR